MTRTLLALAQVVGVGLVLVALFLFAWRLAEGRRTRRTRR